MTREHAEAATQLRAVVGSTVHGLALEGTDDRDEMGVCLEPIEYAAGLTSFEQFEFRTAEERCRQTGIWPEHGHLPKSEPGDLDLKIYTLRKYVRLAVAGNPSILILLFAPPELQMVCTDVGRSLQALAPAFVSRRSAGAFLGFIRAQRERLLGLRGGKRVQRPALEAEHGYDTKFAAHMVRLGFQGIEFVTTGTITLPMPNVERTTCLQVRRGRLSLDHVVELAADLEAQLEVFKDSPTLPPTADTAAAQAFLVRTYSSWWFEHRHGA